MVADQAGRLGKEASCEARKAYAERLGDWGNGVTVLRKRMFEGMVIDGKCLELALEPQNEKDQGWNS